MKCQCERCEQEKECKYYGNPPDIKKNKEQNGEWLCDDCTSKRVEELDDAISRMKDILRKTDE